MSAWDFCCRYVSLCALMACRLFLSSILAAACTLVLRKLSGNQRMLAVSVTAGTWDRKSSKHTHTKKRGQMNTNPAPSGETLYHNKRCTGRLALSLIGRAGYGHHVMFFRQPTFSTYFLLSCLSLKFHISSLVHVHLGSEALYCPLV